MKYKVMVLALLLGACETTAISSGVPSAPSAAPIPSTPLELGDWRNPSAAQVLSGFEQTVTARYGAGLPISAVTADLRRSEFNCAAAPADETGRGDPPAQICRRTVTANNCTHTWQVHLFGEGGVLARPRGIYDRRCGGDGLLGGPG